MSEKSAAIKTLSLAFKCRQADIAKAFAAVSRVINTHTAVPLLNEVLVSADKTDEIILRATDLETTIECRIVASVQTLGVTSLPGTLFNSFLSNLHSESLSLRRENGHNLVTVAEGEYRFLAMDIVASDYPSLPSGKELARFSIPTSKFKDAIESTIFSASSDLARGAILMSEFIKIENNMLVAVATDGYRLAKCITPLDSDTPVSAIRYNVPTIGLSEVLRNLESSGTVEITALADKAGNMAHAYHHLLLNVGTTLIAIRLVDGDYPNYDQVIPVGGTYEFLAERIQLIESIQRISLMSGRNYSVTFDVEDDKLTLSAKSEITGDARETLSLKRGTGENPLQFCFNARYLLEVLKHVRGPLALFRSNGAISPMKISPEPNDSPEQTFVLMPLRGPN